MNNFNVYTENCECLTGRGDTTDIFWFLKYSECNKNVKTFTQEPMKHRLTKKNGPGLDQGAMPSEMFKMTDKLNYI